MSSYLGIRNISVGLVVIQRDPGQNQLPTINASDLTTVVNREEFKCSLLLELEVPDKGLLEELITSGYILDWINVGLGLAQWQVYAGM